MNRQPLALEVSPATFDEIAALLETARCDRVELGGVELLRGPIPALMLTDAEIDACHSRAHGQHGFARLIEFQVIRRLATRKR